MPTAHLKCSSHQKYIQHYLLLFCGAQQKEFPIDIQHDSTPTKEKPIYHVTWAFRWIKNVLLRARLTFYKFSASLLPHQNIIIVLTSPSYTWLRMSRRPAHQRRILALLNRYICRWLFIYNVRWNWGCKITRWKEEEEKWRKGKNCVQTHDMLTVIRARSQRHEEVKSALKINFIFIASLRSARRWK